MHKYWPHGARHYLADSGAYIVTAGTYCKVHILNTSEKRTRFCTLLFRLAEKHGWQLQAWSVMSNHYHFVAISPDDASSLQTFINHLHRTSAIGLNKFDETKGRKVWHQYWDSLITFEKSYFARLNYVHTNPVHHGVCDNAELYEWCSASWFRQNAPTSMVNTVFNFKTDSINVKDDF
jgi:REP-associated tyrosine transposase